MVEGKPFEYKVLLYKFMLPCREEMLELQRGLFLQRKGLRNQPSLEMLV